MPLAQAGSPLVLILCGQVELPAQRRAAEKLLHNTLVKKIIKLTANLAILLSPEEKGRLSFKSALVLALVGLRG